MEDYAKDNEKNIYIIKQKLSEIQLRPGDSCYHFYVEDKFIVKIWTKTVKDKTLYVDLKDDRITLHEKVHVNLYEMKRYTYNNGSEGRVETYINVEQDSRFKNYQPIKYHQISGYSSGDNMPVITLCELIKYLYRLSNLTAFL